jgi:RHS repeat-associated protein
MGNLTSVTRLAGTANAVTTTLTYTTKFNQLATITDPLSHTSSLFYDNTGNLVTLSDPMGNTAKMNYNLAGQPVSVTDPAGNTTRLAYDNGDLITVTDPLGRTTNRFVDALGRIGSLTDPLGRITKFAYNLLNQITTTTDPQGNRTSFVYDPNGNLKSVTDANTHVTQYTYDTMDRVQTRKDPLQNQESYIYDGNGNVTQFTDRRGKISVFSYDGLNRITFAGYGMTAGPTYESTVNYSTYDAGNRLKQVVDSISGTITRGYDDLDRLTSDATPQGTASYTYDNASRRASLTVSGQAVENYTFDNANRLTQIIQGSTTVSFGYDGASRRTTLTLPDGVVTSYSYDSASQLTGINYQNGSTTLGNLTYSYDLLGRRAGVGGSFARTGLPLAVNQTSYNADNELTTWGTANLFYDLNGNMTSDGTHSYTWDARNQLKQVDAGASANFVYDPFGRRNSKTIAGTTTTLLYDGSNAVQETIGANVANSLMGGVDEVFQRADSSGARSFLSDALGSSLALADGTGTIQTTYSFDPFGNTTTGGAANSNTFTYTGRELDAANLNLYYYRARYYNPALQRFISEDPIGFNGGTNFYAYAGGDPINNSDPSGLCTDPGGSGTRYCLEAYIPQSSAWLGPIPFGGDNRGPSPYGGNFRFHQDYGSNGSGCQMGTSKLFWKLPVTAHQDACDITPLSGRKNKKRFRARAAAGDGWGFGLAPDAWYDLTIAETDTGVSVTGFTSDYPNVEVWQYSDSGSPTLVFGGTTGLGPFTGPPNLLLPNYLITVPVVQNTVVPH